MDKPQCNVQVTLCLLGGGHVSCCHGSKWRNKTCMLPGCGRTLWRASMPLHLRRLLLFHPSWTPAHAFSSSTLLHEITVQ